MRNRNAVRGDKRAPHSMVYTVTTFRRRLRLTPHRQWYSVRCLPLGQRKAVREASTDINNQLEGYISTGRLVCSKSRCDSFSRWQKQCSFPPVTSVHFWITNENSTFHVPRLSVSLVRWVSTTQHTLGMNEWRLESERGGRTGYSLLKRGEWCGEERRQGDKFRRPVGSWFFDASSPAHGPLCLIYSGFFDGCLGTSHYSMA